MKSFANLLATSAVALVSMAVAAQAATVLRAADILPDGFPTVEAVKYMSDLLKKETNGELSIQTYPSGMLGDEKDTVQQTQFGVIDINRVNSGVFHNIAKETKVVALPFIFRSVDHMHKVVDGDVGEEILASLAPHNLIGLGYYDSGTRSFYNNVRPINSPADMKGMKIRVVQSDVFVDMMKALGANPTPMPIGEVYSGLQTGVIDGAENNWPSLDSFKHMEVIKYYSLTEHLMIPELLVMSKKTWEKLTPAQQAAVKKSAKASMPKNRELWTAQEKTAEAAVRKAGVTINTMDKAPFSAAMGPVYEKHASDPKLKSLIERIAAVK